MTWPRMTGALTSLLPTPCIVCGRCAVTTANLCLACTDDLPWLDSACVQCGIGTLNLPLVGNRCGACRLQPPPFQHCCGLLHYRAPANTLITNFKFNARFEIGYALTALLARRMQNFYARRAQPELLIPVPLHRYRLRERGYNQSLEIAKWLSAQLHIPVCEAAVQRIRDTAPQTTLHSARQRAANLRHAFRAGDPSRLRGVQRIALIDDVVTTMNTVSEISRVLTTNTINHIDVWCLARAER